MCLCRKALLQALPVTPHETHRNKFVFNLSEWRTYRETLSKGFKGWSFGQKDELWSYNDEQSSILWHDTDRAELLVKGKPLLAKVETVFAHAFLP
jgi:hypothetical protein